MGNGTDADIDSLDRLLESSRDQAPILALFCEFPSNPLLRSPNLARLRSLADKYGFLIVVDETIGNFVNVEVLPYSDIVVSSLTKVFSGDTNWANYEGIQADIIDHVLAVLPEFELAVFQNPTGDDLRDILDRAAAAG